MQEIIEHLKRALHYDEPLEGSLKREPHYHWQPNYPVAIVHKKQRIQEDIVVASLESAELFLEDEVTPTHYNTLMIDFFRRHAPMYLKQVSFMCLESLPHTSFTFEEKYPHDYWKKVQNPSSFKAVIEFSTYRGGEHICAIETNLRNTIRRNKEVPALKPIGFVWIASTPLSLDIRELLHHYFHDKVEMLVLHNRLFYIGWSDTLHGINMRHFLCPPQ